MVPLLFSTPTTTIQHVLYRLQFKTLALISHQQYRLMVQRTALLQLVIKTLCIKQHSHQLIRSLLLIWPNLSAESLLRMTQPDRLSRRRPLVVCPHSALAQMSRSSSPVVDEAAASRAVHHPPSPWYSRQCRPVCPPSICLGVTMTMPTIVVQSLQSRDLSTQVPTVLDLRSQSPQTTMTHARKPAARDRLSRSHSQTSPRPGRSAQGRVKQHPAVRTHMWAQKQNVHLLRLSAAEQDATRAASGLRARWCTLSAPPSILGALSARTARKGLSTSRSTSTMDCPTATLTTTNCFPSVASTAARRLLTSATLLCRTKN